MLLVVVLTYENAFSDNVRLKDTLLAICYMYPHIVKIYLYKGTKYVNANQQLFALIVFL